MKKSQRETEFKKLIENKFNIYNSLFLSLPFRKVTNIGILIPLLNQECRKGLESGREPLEILDKFFKVHTTLESEEEKIDFMFRVIQYVERQVVLYDSVEDAAFNDLVGFDNHVSLKKCFDFADNRQKTPDLIKKLSDFSVRIVFTAHPAGFLAGRGQGWKPFRHFKNNSTCCG